jgi:hypothetical protein
MHTQRGRGLHSWLRAALLCVLAAAPLAQAQDAAALKARHLTLGDALAHNAFARPLVLESSESAGMLKGDIYARIDQPFARLAPALQGSEHWCEILILHLNVKQCRAGTAATIDTLALVVGRKFDQPLAEAYRIEFFYRVVASRPDYQQIVLEADAGPLGTSHYRIVVEAAALDGAHSFLHLSYAYAQGLAARLAMQSYLATLGRAKVGFSVVARQADGAPVYVGDLRGVIERNTMRYYLAIEAYLGALDTPPALQLAKRLNDWHSGVERYPLQLHELERSEYLDLKDGEVRRQRAAGG